jgi:hypothetical protein
MAKVAATLDQIRLQQLLNPFNRPQGIASLSQAASPLSFQYVDQLYPNSTNQNLVNAIIAENQRKANQFNPINFQTGIRQQAPLDMNRFQGVSDMSIIDETTNDEQDQEYIDQVDENNQSGIMKALRSLPGPFNLVLDMLKGEDPEVTSMRNFYRNQYGLTDAGSLASGIMKGYNPVSGGLFGQPIKFGLAGAMQRRIENILGRRAPQTAASAAKVAELRNLQREEMRDRADRGESLSSIGKSTFSGPGMAFERRSGGSSGVKGTSSERNYGGR